MTLLEVQKKAADLYPALVIESVLPHRVRRKIRKVLAWLLVVVVLLLVLAGLGATLALPSFFDVLAKATYQLRGIFGLLMTGFVLVSLLEALYFSYYFKKDSPLDFEVALLAHGKKDADITRDFLESPLGKKVMTRLGVPQREVLLFLADKKQTTSAGEYFVLENDDDPYSTVEEFGTSLIHFDTEFAAFLETQSIDGGLFTEALRWVAFLQKQKLREEAWWHTERLERVPSVGRDWAYGQVYTLEKHGHSIDEESLYQAIAGKESLYEHDIDAMEQALVKQAERNVMLIADESAQAMTVVAAFGRFTQTGKSRPAFDQMRLFVLDGEALLAAHGEKSGIEQTLYRIASQAAQAGNVIMVIPNLDGLVESAQALDVNIKDLFASLLQNTALQIIATATTKGFHESLETHHDLLRSFAKVHVQEVATDALLGVLQLEAHDLEKEMPIIFSLQALHEIKKQVTRFYTEDDMGHKARSLMEDIALQVLSLGKSVVQRQDVAYAVSEKTGVEVGDVSTEERDVLTQLETILHERIIGQDAAITALSSAMRRARAGLNNPQRPTASFLFLGPTGVGKTETTKALAATFFDSEKNIVRIDMSEFSGEEGLEKLIGSYKKNLPGILASKLREQSHGVLLLDEFEKASTQVHDLFLQILDEGFFTDGRGDKVIARNMIIIATSNAGSDLIYQKTKSGEAFTDSQEIVDLIIADHIFKPELVNRFDAAIVFHALTEEHLRAIARLQLAVLEKRLHDKRLEIVIDDTLLNYLIAIGSDQKFGARAMNRAIQDEVERVIADGIISGTISEGQQLRFAVGGDNSLTLAHA